MTPVHVVGLVCLLGVTLILPGAGGPLAAAAIWTLCLLLVARSHANGVLSLAGLYLVLLGMFHLGAVVPMALGLTNATGWSWARSMHLGTALGLFSTATVAFTLGTTARGTAMLDREQGSIQPQRQLFRVGLLVAVLGAAMLWLGVMKLGMLAWTYVDFYERAMREDVRLVRFGLMLFSIGLLVAAVGSTARQMVALGAMFAAVTGPLFLFGFRGPTIVQGAALLAVWVHKDRRLARRLAIAGMLAVFILGPVIRATRDLAQRSSIDRAEIDPLALLIEMGGSLYPLVVTVEQIEAGEPWWLGRSYAIAVGHILPNISLRWKAPGHGSAERVLLPSQWATMREDPWTFERGGGIGFSGVAEPYLNFGSAGVVLIFLLIGLVIQMWERWLATGRFLAAIGAASFGYVLWTVRNDATELLRAVAYAGAIVLVAWLMTPGRIHGDAPERVESPRFPSR